jgi:hypothetical protein
MSRPPHPDPNEILADNLNNVRFQASRHFRNKRREYLKSKTNDLAINNKNKYIGDLYRGKNEFKRGYQTRSNLVKDENGDLLEDSNNTVNRWKSYFSQLLNVHNVSDVRQIEIDSAEPLVPGPNHLEVETAIVMLKSINLQAVIQLPAKLIQTRGETLVSAIHKLITSVWNKDELPDQWKESIILPIHKTSDKTDCNNYDGIILLSTSYKILSNILLSRLSPYIDEITGDHQCELQHNRSATGQIFCIHQILEKTQKYNETVHQIFVHFKKAYDSVRREVLYNIVIESGIPIKSVRLIKMRSNET